MQYNFKFNSIGVYYSIYLRYLLLLIHLFVVIFHYYSLINYIQYIIQ